MIVRLVNRIRNRRRNLAVAAHDALMAALSFPLALYVRLGEEDFAPAHAYLGWGTLLFAAIGCAVFIRMRQYRGLWRFASMPDFLAIAKASVLSVLIFYTLMFGLTRLEGMPRSVPVMHWLLLMVLVAGPRFFYRSTMDRGGKAERTIYDQRKIPVLLIGVTQGAELFIQESKRNPASLYEVVGIVSDDTSVIGSAMYGLKIYGDSSKLALIVNKLARTGRRPQRIVVADDRLRGAGVQRLLEVADALGVPLARLPQMSEFKSGAVEKTDIRPIAIEDLLGRSQTIHDRDAMRKLVEGRRVLVTGAGGTIGGELTRQIAGYGPSQLLMLDLSEYALYQIDTEIAEAHPALSRVALLADVRDGKHIDQVFASCQPELVFHAAAIKHVPLAEANPEEAILTNVFGTRHVADACLRRGAQAMVLISTDKAVHPTNVMGATKRLAEHYCAVAGGAAGNTQFITLRFGNVLGSTGSVVPLFRRQIEKGGPVTLTHKDMRRYFMTVREAVELVLQAAALGRAVPARRYSIFVLDMGEPIRIEDLALQMIRLAGLTPHEDIRIVYTGLRPGEKLYEEMFYSAEKVAKTAHQGILLAAAMAADSMALQKHLPALLTACLDRKEVDAVRLLRSLVPEYQTAGEARAVRQDARAG